MKKKENDSLFSPIMFGGAVLLTIGTFAFGVAIGSKINTEPSINGLDLLYGNSHLREGVHRVVFGDQFYNTLTENSSELNQSFAVKGIMSAFDKLNEINKGIFFDLCTTHQGLTEYGLRQINDANEQSDIMLYVTTENIEIDGKNTYIGVTNHELNYETRELYHSSITFKRSELFQISKDYIGMMKEFTPQNSCAYPLALHEAMHVMGFRHQPEKDSILYPSKTNIYDLTEKDIQMLQRYNTVFYNATYETNEAPTVEEATVPNEHLLEF